MRAISSQATEPMFNLRAFCLIGFLAAASVARGAVDTNQWVIIGSYPAHPTRILAKVKDLAQVNLSVETARQSGSKVYRRYQLVPGLAVLEETNPIALATVSPIDRRTRLLNRITALRQSGLFEYVEPDYIVQANLAPNDQAFVDGTLWGLRNIGKSGGIP